MDVKVFQKFDPEVKRGTGDKCQICYKQFGVFVREHQCKRCLRAVCESCGTKKKDVYKQKMTKQAHRLCDICAKQNQYLQQYIQQSKLVFGNVSDQGLKWSKKINSSGTRIQLSKQLEMSSQSKNSGRFTKDAFNQMWDSYNYSLREFIGLLTFKLNQDDVYEHLRSVYQKILRFYPDEKMENLAYLIIFILCHCDEAQTVEICLFLLELKRTIVQSKELITLYLKTLGMNEEDIKKIGDFVKNKIKRFVSNFSINLVTAQSSIYVISRLIERKKIQEIYIFFSLVIECNKDVLVKNKNNKSECDLTLIRNCNLERISVKYRLLGPVKTHNFIKMIEGKQYESAKSEVNFQTKGRDSDMTISNQRRDSDYYSVKSQQDQMKGPDLRQMAREGNGFKKKSVEPEKSGYEDKRSDQYSPEDLREQDKSSLKSYKKSTSAYQYFDSGNPSPYSPKTQNSNDQQNYIRKDTRKASDESYEDIYSSANLSKSPFRSKSPATQQFQSHSKKLINDPQCKACQIHKKEIYDLKQQLSMKNLEIENLQIRIRLQIENQGKSSDKQKDMPEQESIDKRDYEKAREEVDRMRGEIDRLRNNITNLTQKNGTLEKEKVQLESQLRRVQSQKQLTKKLQQENVLLRNQVQELSLTAKMFKNKLQSASLSLSTESSSSNYQSPLLTVNDSQLRKMNEMLKSSLMQKNKELESLMKQNKLLTYQLESFSGSRQKVSDLEKDRLGLERKNQELMHKIAELSEVLLKEEAQKLKLSEMVFELNETVKQQGRTQRANSTAVQSEKSVDCGIF